MFIIAFDIPREKKNVQRRVQRILHRIKAKKLQFSLWESDNLQKLVDISLFIRANGGQAKY